MERWLMALARVLAVVAKLDVLGWHCVSGNAECGRRKKFQLTRPVSSDYGDIDAGRKERLISVHPWRSHTKVYAGVLDADPAVGVCEVQFCI